MFVVQITASKRHPPSRKSGRTLQKKAAKGQKSFHVPFEEFSVMELGDLLRQLELVKPDHWTVVVSDSDEAQHIDCMKPLTFINVNPPEEDSSPQTMGVLYQFCSRCKSAVRVL